MTKFTINPSKNEQYQNLKAGLYLISTPIGNLHDISVRALRILESLDLLLAEDTRKAKHLYDYYEIHKPQGGIISLNEHNEDRVIPEIIERISDYPIVGYVCDAGTPCISDPGFKLTVEFRDKHIPVFPIPGPSALTAAMSVCGMNYDCYKPLTFFGFLPPNKTKRINFINKIKIFKGVLLFFESPKRIDLTMKDLAKVFDENIYIFVGREITKKFETLWWGKIGDYLYYREKQKKNNPNTLLGEYVIALRNFDVDTKSDYKEIMKWLSLLSPYLRPSDTATVVAKGLKMKKKDIYKKLLKKT